MNSILAESPHEIAYFFRMSAWTDLFMMALTFIFTVLWSVEVGIIVSVSVSLILIVRRSSQPHIRILVSIRLSLSVCFVSDGRPRC